MKKNLLTTFIVSLILLIGIPVAYAVNTPPSTPAWNNSYGPNENLPYMILTSQEIALFWNASTDSNGVAGYYIYRCSGVNCTLPSQPTFTTTATHFTDATLSSGTTYSYAIAAYDTVGGVTPANISAQSTVISPTTSGTASVIVPLISLTQPTNGVGTVGQSFTFDMSQSNAGAGVPILGNTGYSWTWSYGDGTVQSNGTPTSHLYAKPGAYTLTLTIINNSTHNQASVTQTIMVLPVVSIPNDTLRLPLNGDIVDYSGNQLVTQGVGGVPSFTVGSPCVIGQSLTLNGTATGPYVSVSDNGNGTLDGNAPVSLALFVQKNAATASGTVMVKQGVYSLAIAAQGVSASMTNSIGATANLSSSTVANNDTNWHHYAMTYDGTTVTLYFDGAAVASQALGGNLAHVPTANLLLGETISGNTFNGTLSTVRFYNAALTAPQVNYLYNGSQYGDINGAVDNNGYPVVSVYDAYLTIQEVVGSNPQPFTSTQYTQAEVTGDSSPSANDAYMIAQKSIKSILKFPEDLSGE